ncbi:hypothetical protein [Halomicrococcus sp. NG-SE-24]|uniref:hypothetical protein n=1 Tax=Halomicrococcus sp. NG-SE-24 TaxID=3436928 RepID=UPI003D97273B
MRPTNEAALALTVVLLGGVLVGLTGVGAGTPTDAIPDDSAVVNAEPAQSAPHDECVERGGKDCRPNWFQSVDRVGEPPWIL